MPFVPAAWLFHALLVSASIATAARDPIPERCNQYEPLYQSIDRDLELFKLSGGITPNLIFRTMVTHSAGYREKGLAVAFYHGRAYVISHTRHMDLARFGHHVELWAAYLRLLVHLESKYGSVIPNVEFVWHTIDRPVRLTVPLNASAPAAAAAGGPGGTRRELARTGAGSGAGSRLTARRNRRSPPPPPLKRTAAAAATAAAAGGLAADATNYPVFRFCKSEAHPDILVPYPHFYMKRYQSEYLDRIPQFNAEHPWEHREQRVFARFTAYFRYVHPNDSYTQRLDERGRPLCEVQGSGTAICPVREYLKDWAAKYPQLDVRVTQQVPMQKHANYRYLLHVDGQGLSTKLELLLALGSLVMKEESGYRAFYHHLLRPGEHYVPVWRPGSGPQDILAALDWAVAHDEDAHRIALAGQAFVARYLSAEARECFWLRLLVSYGGTLTYDPVVFRNVTVAEDGSATGRWRYIKPVARFLEEDVPRYVPDLATLPWEP